MRVFHQTSLVMLSGVTLCIVAVMVYFGIRLRGFRPDNIIEWLPAGEGVYFGRSGMIYKEAFTPEGGDGSDELGVSIELVLRCEALDKSIFQYILSVNDGSDERQLLIGQWKNWLIIMNGDDYDGRKGIGKVYVDLGVESIRAVWLSIVSDGTGTRVYLNGKQVKYNSALQLHLPGKGKKTWLVLGSSVYGRHSWQGALMGLALYGHALREGTVIARAKGWATDSTGFEFDRSLSPFAFYRFERSADGGVKNLASDRFHLQVPARIKILKKEILGIPGFAAWGRWAIVRDVVINFIGFLPLGSMLCVVARRFGGWWRRNAWLAAVAVAFGFSLSLEVIQAWIPSRDSSLLDLLLNTGGAGVGATLASWCARVYRVC